MKKVKLSLAAVAFLLATGGAFATHLTANSGGLDVCDPVTTPECVEDEIDPCCIKDPKGSPTDPSNLMYFPEN